MAPSRMRWSKVRLRYTIGRMAITSPRVIADHHRALLDRPHAQDTALRLVDDRGGKQRAADAVVGDGEGAALDFVRLELARPRPVGQIIDRCAPDPAEKNHLRS